MCSFLFASQYLLKYPFNFFNFEELPILLPEEQVPPTNPSIRVRSLEGLEELPTLTTLSEFELSELEMDLLTSTWAPSINDYIDNNSLNMALEMDLLTSTWAPFDYIDNSLNMNMNNLWWWWRSCDCDLTHQGDIFSFILITSRWHHLPYWHHRWAHRTHLVFAQWWLLSTLTQQNLFFYLYHTKTTFSIRRWLNTSRRYLHRPHL